MMAGIRLADALMLPRFLAYHQEADPVSLIRFAKVLVTKNAVAKFEEMWG